MIARLISRLAGLIANSEIFLIKTPLIFLIQNKYKINLNDAEIKNRSEYRSLNQFFTRKLDPSSRPISSKNKLASPVDGTIMDFGKINARQSISAKGTDYSVSRLLGQPPEEIQSFYDNGKFACIYLSPSNYHRVHCPISGYVTRISKIKGSFLPVHPHAVRKNPDRYVTNERLCIEFSTNEFRYAIILVGSILVGSVVSNLSDPCAETRIEKGTEIGHFAFGSSVILLCSPNLWEFGESIKLGGNVKMGEGLGALAT